MRFLACFLASVIAATDAPSPPDVSKGEIAGKVALYVMPLAGVRDVGTGATFDRVLPANGCEVHLAPTQDLDRELVYDCSTWILPPEGRYRVWLEAPGAISDGYGVLMWDHQPFRGRGQAIGFALEPAGRVALADDVPLAPGTSFRLVHLTTVKKGVMGKVFDRRVPATSVRSGVPMPAGSLFGGIFDAKSGDALALTRPLNVQTGKTVFASPAPPKAGTDVITIVTRPRYATDDVSLTLSVDGKPRMPDVEVVASDHVFGVWYGVEGRKATLGAASRTLRLDAVELALRPGKVVTYRGKFAPLPSVALSIRAPEAFAGRAMSVELRRADAREALQRVEIAANQDHRFESVPAEPLELVVSFDAWEFRKPVDLTSGADASVTFDLDPLILTGTVFHGRDPAPGAAVEFHADTGVVRAVADDTGRYEAILWRRDDYVAEVKIAGQSMPFVEGPFEVRRSTELDIHVPRTRFEVDVTDAVTGKAIAGASVFAGSTSSQRNVLQTAVTDENGRAILPPVRTGTLHLRAVADGYYESEPMRDVVARIDQEGRYDIRLRPVGDTKRVTVKIDSRPAAGAEVWAVASAAGHQPPLWRGVADTAGHLAVPNAVRDAIFLVRAEGSAPAVRRLAEEWTLSSAVAPLTLKLERQSRLALWIDGVRVSGVALVFLTRALEATGADGIWTAPAVPARSLRVLAWREAAIESGAYDAVAETLDYPWPAVIRIRVVD